jgi:hypothetical protein
MERWRFSIDPPFSILDLANARLASEKVFLSSQQIAWSAEIFDFN